MLTLFAITLMFQKRFFCLTYPGKVKMWLKVVKSGMVRFRTSRTFCSSLLRSSVRIRGQTSPGVATHLVRSRMAKWQVRARVKKIAFEYGSYAKQKTRSRSGQTRSSNENVAWHATHILRDVEFRTQNSIAVFPFLFDLRKDHGQVN